MSLPGPRTRYEWRAFDVAGIPVRFSAWFGLTVWAVLARAGSVDAGLVHLVAITASVLIHELGHGLAARRYRLRPSILIHGFGGWCEHEEARRRDEALAVVAAGPGAGLALGVLAGALWWAIPGPPWWLDLLLWDLAWMGLVWTAVNLLPVLPLDGGSILVNLLERRRSISRPLHRARQVGVVAGVLGAVAGAWLGEVVLVLLMAVLAWQNATALGAVPALPGITGPATGGRGKAPVRRWWVPGPAVAVAAGTLGVALVLGAAIGAPAVTDALAVGPGAPGRPWTLATWPLAPHGRGLALASAVIALWLVGPPVERRLGAGGLVALLAAATGVAGVAGLVVSLGTGGALAGPVPVVLAVVAAWAWAARGAVGPDAVLPVSPRMVLAAVVAVDLADRWAQGDPVRAAADLAGVGVGVAFVARGDGTWRRLEAWWRLRDPPEVPIDRR